MAIVKPAEDAITHILLEFDSLASARSAKEQFVNCADSFFVYQSQTDSSRIVDLTMSVCLTTAFKLDFSHIKLVDVQTDSLLYALDVPRLKLFGSVAMNKDKVDFRPPNGDCDPGYVICTLSGPVLFNHKYLAVLYLLHYTRFSYESIDHLVMYEIRGKDLVRCWSEDV